MNDLKPNEAVLTGQWLVESNRAVADETCKRIEWLVTSRLEQLATTAWETLYRDPQDGRLWERAYPQSEMHGGGPPALRLISSDAAASKYGAA